MKCRPRMAVSKLCFYPLKEGRSEAKRAAFSVQSLCFYKLKHSDCLLRRQFCLGRLFVLGFSLLGQPAVLAQRLDYDPLHLAVDTAKFVGSPPLYGGHRVAVEPQDE